MADDKISAAVDAAKGKKAKLKTLDEKPTGTKVKKLEKDVLAALEEAFPKAKLNKVRVHTGGNTKDVAKSIRARAFCVGEDIFFGQPSDAKNKHLLAHELTHVIQQGKGRMPKEQKGKALTSK